ncbi:MAG: hypothetical protein OSJ66_08835 [Clostridia bacterium]|nr:hypothetical protein [Clostridia bacterium]
MTKRNEWITVLQKCLEDFIRDFPQNGEQAKEDYAKKVKQITDMATESARKSVACLGNNVNIILSCLEKIESPTKEELIILSDQFAGMHYWIDRRLSSMAEKANLKARYRPEVGESLKLIKQIEDKATNFIKQYTGKENLDIVLEGILEIGKKL